MGDDKEPLNPHPGWFTVFIQLMKLRVIVLLQITAICAILVHDMLARHGLIDVDRTWSDTLYACLITVVGGTLSACLLYTSPSPRDKRHCRMPSSA